MLTNSPKILRVIFFFQILRNLIYISKLQKKNWQKGFCFLDNCNCSCSVKLSLLRREYLPSVVNVLTDSPKTLHITKRDFFQLNSFAVTINYNKKAAVQISAVSGTVYHVACPRVFWNGPFKHLSNHVFHSPYFP